MVGNYATFPFAGLVSRNKTRRRGRSAKGPHHECQTTVSRKETAETLTNTRSCIGRVASRPIENLGKLSILFLSEN